jgi:hypothetical protein
VFCVACGERWVEPPSPAAHEAGPDEEPTAEDDEELEALLAAEAEGAEVVEVAAVEESPPPAPTVAGEPRPCPKCRSLVVAGDRFCGECGARMP